MSLEKDLVQKTAKNARDLVEEIDEPFRNLVYPIIFEHLFNEEMVKTKGSNKKVNLIPKYSPEIGMSQSQEGISKILIANFDWSKYSHIYKLDPYEQYLLVLKIALEEFEIDGLSPPEIQKILDEKYRIAKSYNAVSMALSNLTGKDVSRLPRGTGFVYRISQKGLERVQNSYDKLSVKDDSRKNQSL